MAVTDDDLMFGLKNYDGVLLSPSVYEAIQGDEHARELLKEMQQTATFLQNKNHTTLFEKESALNQAGLRAQSIH